MSIDILLPALKEIFYFNIWESFIFLSVFLIVVNIRVNLKEMVFHIFMLSILNYVVTNTFKIAILMQIIYILIISFYFNMIFKTKISKNFIINTVVFFSIFTIEIIIGIIFQYVFNIKFISMDNDYIKFLSMLPLRCIEVFLVYIYYKMKGGGLYHE